MRIHAREGVMVLEGPAELEAAVMVCASAARSRSHDAQVRTRARWIVEEASRADVLAWRVGNPERLLPLPLPEALVLVEASRRFHPSERAVGLQGDEAIVAAARKFAAVEL